MQRKQSQTFSQGTSAVTVQKGISPIPPVLGLLNMVECNGNKMEGVGKLIRSFKWKKGLLTGHAGKN